ncbi:hypothetical protein IJJ18_00130 [Candidatus Saccharibacteria bacterium]|nr:hypothetical protein [Candidatus Saccharibacteria bacterium]
MEYVRKAETLTSLDELNLSPTKIARMAGHEKGPYVELVVLGRKLAVDPKFDKLLPRQKEVVAALDEAGFIRHDLYRTFKVLELYGTLEECSRTLNSVDEKISTLVGDVEWYENAEPITDQQLAAIDEVLSLLRDRKREAIIYRFGLDDDEEVDTIYRPCCRTFAEMEECMGINQTTIRSHLLGALSVLRRRWREHKFPDLYDFSVDEEKPCDVLSINERVSAYLKKANVKTLRDILSRPKEDWLRDDNFSDLTVGDALSIEKRVQALGYKDFTILS